QVESSPGGGRAQAERQRRVLAGVDEQLPPAHLPDRVIQPLVVSDVAGKRLTQILRDVAARQRRYSSCPVDRVLAAPELLQVEAVPATECQVTDLLPER